ncbi:MAG: site-specific integrase [Bacteroidales bacterium]|jgi:integrase|nr:site-specific integrase [Bacteroidales bacterium]
MFRIQKHCQFLLDKINGSPEAKIRYRVKWDKKIVSFSLGYRVETDKWNLEEQICKKNTTHTKDKFQSNAINAKIHLFENIINEIFERYEFLGRIPSISELKNDFNLKIGKTNNKFLIGGFFDVFDEFIKSSGFLNNWTKPTYQKFNLVKNHLFEFDNKITFENINNEKLQNFIQYQINIPFKNTTIEKHISLIKYFLRWSKNNNYYGGLLHETFKPKFKGVDGNQKEIIYLTWEELINLYDFNFQENKKYLERVRDVFCFCCFTGLRFSDVKKLKKTDVKTDYINVITKKTVDLLKIELNDYSRKLLQKYKDIKLEDDKALPVISNTKMNEHLKELGKMVGINEQQRIVYFIGNQRFEETYPKYKLLTTHTGRRTFVVNSFYLGIPAEVIMKWTGHSDYNSMKPYIKIVDELKKSEMNKFNRK